MHKADKELSEVAARWEEIKKGTSQVYSEVCDKLSHDCFVCHITTKCMLSIVP